MKYSFPSHLHRKRALVQAWGVALSLLGGWAALLWLGHHATAWVAWPLGVLGGLTLQKGMLSLRRKAIHRQLLRHAPWNDRIGDWLLCRPFLTRLDLERHQLQFGGEEGFQVEERSWLRILPRAVFVLSGLARLARIDFDSKWIQYARRRGRLPHATSLDAAATLGLWLSVLAATIATDTLGEFLLFWCVPFACLLPFFETRKTRTG